MCCGIACDAGVSFKIAETEHGASPTRSATVRRVTTAFLSDTFPVAASRSYLDDEFITTTGNPFAGNQTTKVWGSFGDAAEGVALL